MFLWGIFFPLLIYTLIAKDLATVALQTQALSLLLLRTSESTSRPSSITPIELDGAQLPSRSSIELGDEAILLPERREEATAGLALLHPATEKSPYKSVRIRHCAALKPISQYLYSHYF
jgi:hypothetical protein